MANHVDWLGRPTAWVVGTGLIVVLADLLTKAWIIRFLPVYTHKTVIPGFFNLVHVRNTGAAFSFLAGAPNPWRRLFFIVVDIFAVGFVIWLFRTVGSRVRVIPNVALGLIVGGAIGNLLDRLRWGEVVDFLDFYVGSHHWPAFNVADMAISCGAVLLMFHLFRDRP